MTGFGDWDQLPLDFGERRHDAPRCAMCPRPAAPHSNFCTRNGCTNRERICKVDGCGQLFIRGIHGAGQQYCATHAGKRGANIRQRSKPEQCAWCSERHGRNHGAPHAWPYICNPCLDPIRLALPSLSRHHVNADLARKLTIDSTCAIPGCNRDLLTRTRLPNGRYRIPLVVDHDHACCPASDSCGRCVRGFICTWCNLAEAFIGGDPATAEGLAYYLKQWTPL